MFYLEAGLNGLIIAVLIFGCVLGIKWVINGWPKIKSWMYIGGVFLFVWVVFFTAFAVEDFPSREELLVELSAIDELLELLEFKLEFNKKLTTAVHLLTKEHKINEAQWKVLEAEEILEKCKLIVESIKDEELKMEMEGIIRNSQKYIDEVRKIINKKFQKTVLRRVAYEVA